MENYRSLRHLIVPLARCNVVTGPNGSGKSSLYRALRLLADSARRAVNALAREGGPAVDDVGGAGQEGAGEPQTGLRRRRLRLRDGSGHPKPGISKFAFDPEIKTESIWMGPVAAAVVPDRRKVRPGGPHSEYRGRMADGVDGTPAVRQHANQRTRRPAGRPGLALRDRWAWSWRFYDHVRTDAGAPARSPRSALARRC